MSNYVLRPAVAHTALALSLATAFFAACGGGAPNAATPISKTEATTADGGAAPLPNVKTAPAETAAPAPAAPEKPVAPTTSIAVGSSQMLGELKAIGIDPAHPGDLGKIEMSKKKKLMKLFVKSLGMASCEGCHVPGDFKADTHNKKLATSMWDHFVKGLKAKSGEPVFCDSCHQGHTQLLVRDDKKALSQFMKANYEDKLERSDKKDHSCGTCHSDPFEGKVFAKLWKIAP
jgi:hypothetical protein